MTLKIPSDLADWIEKRARELNRPKSEIVREALIRQRKQQQADSVTARAGELVGKFAGSKDSSHKRNLKGFGACKRS